MMNDHENNLFATLAFGELSEVQALLKKGVNLDEHKNARGETASHHTLFTGYMDRAKLLLEHNASPNIKDNYRQTILHKLISFNSIDKMEFLLQNATNIDLEIKNHYGFTPLYSSVFDANIKAAELLLKNGADANFDSFNKHNAKSNHHTN
ncbi:ankyrin repeat domain-containing protein [Rickettsia gravesii]|uniref:ankyrin repeat domain-containing protein n=1 Tax=Rickettsia gravesii TaxID=354585 RepID=UPI0012F925DF|nr:ankyrin repeat domain-containing protein [Rickettsia gravesii]